MTTAETTPIIEARIAGAFNGWVSGRVFFLDDDSGWLQTSAESAWTLLYWPDAKVYRDADGGHRLTVDKMEGEVKVRSFAGKPFDVGGAW